jgi:uncharacterized protein YrrD
MKYILLFLFLFGFKEVVFAQEKSVVKILNRELKKELKHQVNLPNFNGDTIRLIEEFKIDQNKILSFTIKKTSPYFSGVQIIKQEVPLQSIVKISKDTQLILMTKENAVSTHYNTVGGDDPKEQKNSERFFYLYIEDEKQNDDLGNELQQAFEKAGYPVEKDNWYDE